MSELRPGKFLAKVKDYGLGETKSGDPQVMIRFGFEIEGQNHEHTWFGSLKEGKAREITIDTLLRCGFWGEDISQLADGLDSGLLDTNKDVQIVLEYDVDPQGNQKIKIKWVNEPGGSAFQNRMKKHEASAKLSGMNLKGDLYSRRQGMDGKAKQEPTKTFGEEGFVGENLPF